MPFHIRWSGPPLAYDLEERADRIRVYEQVLREGTEDDVRFYVDADQLREVFDELVLPPSVRRAWRDWLRRQRRGAWLLSHVNPGHSAHGRAPVQGVCAHG